MVLQVAGGRICGGGRQIQGVDRPKELLSQFDYIIADTDTMLSSTIYGLSVELQKSPSNFHCCNNFGGLAVVDGGRRTISDFACRPLLTLSLRHRENGPKIALFRQRHCFESKNFFPKFSF